MITTQLLRPESIVVVGHRIMCISQDVNGGYPGELRAVNPKERKCREFPPLRM